MKTRHKNIFKAGLQLCAALIGTLLTFFQVVIVSLLSSKSNSEDDAQEFYGHDSDGNLIRFKGDDIKIIGK